MQDVGPDDAAVSRDALSLDANDADAEGPSEDWSRCDSLPPPTVRYAWDPVDGSGEDVASQVVGVSHAGRSYVVFVTYSSADADPYEESGSAPPMFEYPSLGWENTGTLRIWSPLDDELVTVGTYESPIATSTGAPSVADVTGDGAPDIVVLAGGCATLAVGLDGSILWNSPWPSHADCMHTFYRGDPGRALALAGSPLLVDLVGDAAAEVVVYRSILDGRTGEPIGRLDGASIGIDGRFGPLLTAADLDQDGRPEILAGTAVYDASGALVWDAEGMDGFAAVGDVSPEPGSEIVVARYDELVVLSFESRRSLVRRSFECPAFAPFLGPPTLGDSDRDGRAEIFVSSAGALRRIDVVENELLEVWSVPVDDSRGGVLGTSLVDLDGDGGLELLHTDERALRIIDAESGLVLVHLPHRSRTRLEYPTPFDVDGDGSIELLTGNGRDWAPLSRWGSPGSTLSTVQIFGSADALWRGPIGAPWSHHAFADDTATFRAWPAGPGSCRH